MPIVLGVDLGTTKITALAVNTQNGDVLASCTLANQAETTGAADKARAHSEWDAAGIAEIACQCLRGVAGQIDAGGQALVGLGITGQQHGVVLVDDRLEPLTPLIDDTGPTRQRGSLVDDAGPTRQRGSLIDDTGPTRKRGSLINWQDRRADQFMPGKTQTYVQEAVQRAGPEAPQRTGCKLAAGYMGTTLFWMKQTQCLPGHGQACFLMDYFAALLTGQAAVTDATCGASSGLFNIVTGDWDVELLAALELPRTLFPAVRTSGELLGGLTQVMAQATALPEGLPVFVGIGDNQASFLGSVGKPNFS